MGKERKPFGETKAGKLLKNIGSPILDIVGNVVPGAGIISNVIDMVTKDTNIPSADKAKIISELETELKFAELDVRDRESARSRQVEMAKAGANDWLHNVVGVFIMLLLAYVAFVIVFVDIVDESSALFHNFLGIIEGAAISMINFYFGSSKSSHDKNRMLTSYK